MRRADVPTAIDGILFDANLKAESGASAPVILAFVTERLESLKKQLVKEGLYNNTAFAQGGREQTEPEWE